MITFNAVGRVCGDPEIKQVGDTNVASFRIAVKTAGEKNNDADNPGRLDGFFSVDVWGRSADFVSNYVKKGAVLQLSGELRHRTWEDKDTGKKREGITLVAHQVSFTPSQPARGDSGSSEQEPVGAGSGQKKDPFDV